MPNHTANNFTITGPLVDIHRFIKAVKNDNSNLDFNGVFPMPEDLRMTTSPVRIQTQEEIDKIWADWREKTNKGEMGSFEKERPFGLGITQAKYDELIAKYGVADWYQWSIINWGTKWNAYNVGNWSIDEGGNGYGRATIYYETAWSPVTNLWLKVSKNYPTLEFFHEFADEGGGFLGDETIVNGEITYQNEYDWNSDDGITLREGLGRYYPED